MQSGLFGSRPEETTSGDWLAVLVAPSSVVIDNSPPTPLIDVFSAFAIPVSSWV